MRPVSIATFTSIPLLLWLLDDVGKMVYLLLIYGGISSYWADKCNELFEAGAASEERF